MKKLIVLILIAVSAYLLYPILQEKGIAYAVRDKLKTADLTEYIPVEYKIAGIKISTAVQNTYPNYDILATLNYNFNVQLPEFMIKEVQQRVAYKICSSLDKLHEQPQHIRQVAAQVIDDDSVKVNMTLQDNNQHTLMKYEQYLKDCPNFSVLLKP